MSKFKCLFLILVSLCFTFAAVAQADCPTIVKAAFDTADTVCAETDRNQVCYGNVLLTATPRDGVDDLAFEKAGDRVSAADIQTLKLSSMSLTDNSWGVALLKLQANLPDTLPGQNVTFVLFGDVEIQNAVSDPETERNPLQAFYFQSGSGDAPCAEAPDSGILVQTPEGAVKVNLQVNGLDIQLGSTVYLQAQPSDTLKISVLEGEAQVTAQAVTQTVPAGQQVSVPLDANLQAAGTPNPPQPYTGRDIQGLTAPVDVLPEVITIAAAYCTLTSSQVVNIRQGPGRNYPVMAEAQVGKATPAKPVSQAAGADGLTWYKLGYFDAWVRSDVVDAVGDCASLPVQTTLPPTPVVNTSSPVISSTYSMTFFYNGTCPYIDVQFTGPKSGTGRATAGQDLTFTDLPPGDYQCTFTSWVPDTGPLNCDFSLSSSLRRCVCGQGPDCT